MFLNRKLKLFFVQLMCIFLVGCASQPMKKNSEGEFRQQTISFTSDIEDISCTLRKEGVELAQFTTPYKYNVTVDTTAPLDVFCVKEGYFDKRYILEVKAVGETALMLFGAVGGAIAGATKTSNGSYQENLHIDMKKTGVVYN
jgi:hypothetical protein